MTQARQEVRRRARAATTASSCIAPTEALELVKSMATRKFDETVEAAFRLGVDPRKADQMIRGTVSLPHGTGKSVRVAVFAAGDAAREAEEAGADVVGADDLVAQVEGGLPRLRRRHRHPRPHGPGRQARPHARPARPDAEPEDRHRHQRRRQDGRRVQGGQGRVPHRPLRQRARADRQGELRRRGALLENYHAVLDEMLRAKPASAEGPVPQGASPSSSTMGPGVKVDPTVTRVDEHASRGGVVRIARFHNFICRRPPVSLEVMESAPQGPGPAGRGALATDGTSRVSAAASRVRFCERQPDGETREGRGRRRDPHQAGGSRRHRAHRVPRPDGPRARRRCGRRCAAAGTEYKVFKNTLARRAVETRASTSSPSMLEGPVAIAFVRGDAVAAAKALRDFGRTTRRSS